MPQAHAKYHRIFRLKSRFIESSCPETQNNLLTKPFVDVVEVLQDSELATVTINDDSPSLAGHQPASLSAVNRPIPTLTSTIFEGVTSIPLQSPPTIPLEGASEGVANPLEAPSEPLPSNIEDRSNNLEK